MRKFILVASLALAISAPVLAHASIFDAPPALKGQKSLRLFTVPGVVTAGGLGTFFTCTNISPAPVTIGVQLYAADEVDSCNDADASSVTVAPGATVSLHTQNTSGSSYLQSLPITTPPIFMSLGMASILSTSKKVVCNASVNDVANSPPLTSTRLGVYGKKGTIGD
jgi:hypothetical protein